MSKIPEEVRGMFHVSRKIIHPPAPRAPIVTKAQVTWISFCAKELMIF